MPNNLDILLEVEALSQQVLESVQAYAPIQGASGADGREVTLRVLSQILQWKYTDEVSYTNLIDFNTITLAASQITQDANYRFVTDTEKNTWNGKQNAITNPVTGTGTTNKLLKWSSSSAVSDSVINELNGRVQIKSTTDAGYDFDLNGTSRFVGRINATGGGGNIAHGIANGHTPAIFVTTTANTWTDILSFGEGSRVGVFRGFQNGGNTIGFRFSGFGNNGSFFDYAQIYGQVNSLSSGGLRVYLTTASTSPTTGSFVTDGGAGIAGRLTCNDLAIATSSPPASASATGTTGQVAWDANYVYVCTATNSWKRSAISTW